MAKGRLFFNTSKLIEFEQFFYLTTCFMFSKTDLDMKNEAFFKGPMTVYCTQCKKSELYENPPTLTAVLSVL